MPSGKERMGPFGVMLKHHIHTHTHTHTHARTLASYHGRLKQNGWLAAYRQFSGTKQG